MPLNWGVSRFVVTAVVATCIACSKPEAPAPAAVPGLGEIMTLNQMRHSKLWFAGEAGNWDLAAYELDELQEGLDDAARFHPTHKDSPLPIPALIQKIMTKPMLDLRAAVDKHDPARFHAAYDELTAGCNACHQTTNFGFNVVTRPSSNPFSNQSFTAAGPKGPGV